MATDGTAQRRAAALPPAAVLSRDLPACEVSLGKHCRMDAEFGRGLRRHLIPSRASELPGLDGILVREREVSPNT